MPKFAFFGLAVALSACVYAPEAARPEGMVAASPVSAATFVAITAVLPDASAEGLPPDALGALRDGRPVRLDLTLQRPLVPNAVDPSGLYDGAEPCPFGPVRA